ncbi:hypothetical protein LOK49_LG09G00083 [Camellia lanceoleosa]|uniref:Uncharacterized protein n=1 Tax=Camellia lanceoleosa TaxID=1840588 RepID=A0ACC0GE64_9ERIC|nr:hypothetical protein LOK49_LG09G00083 [Camellia lanceoleosa]
MVSTEAIEEQEQENPEAEANVVMEVEEDEAKENPEEEKLEINDELPEEEEEDQEPDPEVHEAKEMKTIVHLKLLSELKSVWRERGGASRSRARVGIWNIEVLAWGLKSCKDQRTLRLAFAGPDWNLKLRKLQICFHLGGREVWKPLSLSLYCLISASRLELGIV